jgi:hypothetical protein
MTTRAEHAKQVLAIGLCRIVGIEPIDSVDGSPNWWMFSETASKVIDDLQERGFLKESAPTDA